MGQDSGYESLSFSPGHIRVCARAGQLKPQLCSSDEAPAAGSSRLARSRPLVPPLWAQLGAELALPWQEPRSVFLGWMPGKHRGAGLVTHLGCRKRLGCPG